MHGTKGTNSPPEDASDGHHEHILMRPSDATTYDPGHPHHGKVSTSKVAHPLAGYSREQLSHMGELYAREKQGITDEVDVRAFRLGAIIAGDMDVDDDLDSLKHKYAAVDGLTDEERTILVNEVEHKWQHPNMLYFLVTGDSF